MKARATKKNGLPIRGERCFGARVEIVDTLAFGEEFEVVEEYDGWLYIEGKGWCDASYTEPVTFDAGSGGSGGASSWNDLEDKPFGEAVEYSTLVPEMTITLTDIDGQIGCPNPFVLALEEGKEYTVVWQGEEYALTAVPSTGMITIGNRGYIGGEDTGEPFLMLYSEEEAAFAVAGNAAGNYSVSISAEEEVVKTLDPKFLPEPMFLYVV